MVPHVHACTRASVRGRHGKNLGDIVVARKVAKRLPLYSLPEREPPLYIADNNGSKTRIGIIPLCISSFYSYGARGLHSDLPTLCELTFKKPLPLLRYI